MVVFTVLVLFQEELLPPLYCTWYFETGTSLWGVVQFIIRAGFPTLKFLNAATSVSCDGTTEIYIGSIYNNNIDVQLQVYIII